jgi:GNAT superfamily N-acetyltransferase
MVTLRNLRPDDYNFVLSSWLKSYRNSRFGKGFTNEVYYRSQTDAILGLLSTARVVVACDPTDERHVFGYAVGQESPDGAQFWLHYCYVKKFYRRLGIARQLVRNLSGRPRQVRVTHWMPVCRKLGWERVTL